MQPGVCRLGPSGTRSAPPTSILDSAGLRRLRHGGHRLRAAPRPFSRLPTAVASIPRHGCQLLLLRPSVCRPARQGHRAPPTSILNSAELRRLHHGGHQPHAAPRLAHDCQLPLPWPGVCCLGPSGTQSAPPASTLGSALWWLCHGGHRPHAVSPSRFTTASRSRCGPACASSAH